MGKNKIRWLDILPVKYDDVQQLADFKITFQYKHSDTTYIKYKGGESGSLRVYYRNETSGAAAQHIDITKEDPNTLYIKRHKGKRYTKVVYLLTGLPVVIQSGQNTMNTFLFRAHLRLYSVKDHSKLLKTGKTDKWKENLFGQPSSTPQPAPKRPSEEEQPLFQIATYSPPPEDSEDDTPTVAWVNFTDCITLPSYDVNREDVTESWDDANYNQHVLVPNKKIKGKFSMLFPSMERYNEFMDLIYKAKLNDDWSPGACVYLHVQINNELDYEYNTQEGTLNPQNARAWHEAGHFTIKIDSNPWVKPIFGHFDRYSPLNVTIEQMDDSD